MKQNKLSLDLISPVSRKERKQYPYKRIDMHSIQATKPIIGEKCTYRVIGNRGDKVADFFTTYAVFNSAFEEVKDSQTISELHELTLYLSLDFYIEGLRNAFTAYEDDDGVMNSTTEVVTQPISEQNLTHLASLWDAYKAIKTYSEIPIDEARMVRQTFMTFWEGYKERYQEIQRLPRTPINEEGNKVRVEKMYLESLVYKLTEWVSDDIDKTTPIPDLISLNSDMLHESEVDYTNDSLTKLEKGNVFLIEYLRQFMFYFYLPLAIVVFVLTFNIMVFAFPVIYFFGLKQSLAMLVPGYRAKLKKGFIDSHRHNKALLEMSAKETAHRTLEKKGTEPFDCQLTYRNFGTGSLYTALVFFGAGIWLFFTRQLILLLLISFIFGFILLLLSFVLPRLEISKMTVAFKKGEITITRLSTVYSEQIGKLSIDRKKNRFKIRMGTEQGMERSFAFKDKDHLEQYLGKIKRWADAENVNLELL